MSPEPAGAARRVILHADDFGLHPALNAGIERAHREGLVTSASLMPPGPAFDDAVRRCRALTALDLGLHLTLVGVPGLPPTLSRFFLSYPAGFSSRKLAGLLRRQLDALLRVHRLTISHLDSHQHLHAFPPIMRLVCAVAAEYGVPAVRLPLDGPCLAPITPNRRLQAALLRVCARLSRRYIAAHGLRTSDYFFGMAVSGHLTPDVLAAYLRAARPGTTEVVCHPGTDNRALAAAFSWGYDWEGELSAVCAAVARQAAATEGLALTGWSGA